MDSELNKIAAEAAKEISYFVRSRGGTDEREFERIIQAVCEKAYQEGYVVGAKAERLTRAAHASEEKK